MVYNILTELFIHGRMKLDAQVFGYWRIAAFIRPFGELLDKEDKVSELRPISRRTTYKFDSSDLPKTGICLPS
jgi:hypothetical protein